MLIDDLKKQFQQNELPIVFSYDGQEYSGFNRDFERLSSTSEQINRGECHTTLYRHIPSGTLWTVIIRHYPEYNALEWQAEIPRLLTLLGCRNFGDLSKISFVLQGNLYSYAQQRHLI